MAHNHNAIDDDDTVGDSTWASMSLAISDEGTCPKHPHIKLRETGADGFVYQKESCPECDKEFQQQRQSLRDRKRELDLQLQQLSMDDTQPVVAADDDESEEENVATPAPVHTQPPANGPPYAGQYQNSGLNMEALSSQMAMMQQMQEWMLKQKDMEMESLRNKVDSYQKELLQKEVEIALLKEKLKQQEERMQHEIKLIKLSATAGANKRAERGSNKKDEQKRNIHIQELHVQVGANLHDGSNNGEVDPKVIQSATKAATTAALNKAADAAEMHEKELEEREINGSNGEILTIKAPPPAQTKKNQKPRKEQKPKEYTFVPENGNGKLKEASSEEEEEEGNDVFDPETPPWEASKLTARKPPPGSTVAEAALAPKNSLRKDPMKASVKSIEAPKQHGVSAAAAAPIAMNSNETGLPMKKISEAKDVVSSQGIPTEVRDGTSTVPSTEDVTLSTMDQQFFSSSNARPSQNQSFNPYQNKNQVSNNDDERSILSAGNTVASSTYGEDRQKVVSQTLLDPYGDKGRYSGVVLRSTGMPHGLGRMVYEDDGRTYEGDWRHGRWHGFGRATFANGDSYEGEYRFDQRHGRGKYCWSDGRIYDGEFAEDKRHGKGTFKWPDGATYEGDFHQGQREGHGRYTFSDGGYYTGSWVDGRYEGFGECHWEDGRKYKGEWRAGMAHGQGVETYPDGRVRHDGQWIDDEPIRVNR